MTASCSIVDGGAENAARGIRDLHRVDTRELILRFVRLREHRMGRISFWQRTLITIFVHLRLRRRLRQDLSRRASPDSLYATKLLTR